MSDPVARIADAVLYEGYVLWPYRRSAMKNRQRWTWGGVFPPAWSAEHPDDAPRMRVECLVEGEGDVEVTIRFLHVVERRPAELTEDGGLRFVDELRAGGERHLAWEEATEREIRIARAPGTAAIAIPAGAETELLDGGAGAIERRWAGLRGVVTASTEEVVEGVRRVRVEVANTTDWDGAEREEALSHAFVSTHAMLRSPAAAFVSQTDPPQALRSAAEACVNQGAWPVLVGEEGARDTVLASPIILSDHPQIAPESPGDLFDGGEIDQLLILNILALTEEEQAEMRASDPRAAEILDRCAGLSNEELMRLHGAIREMGPVGGAR